MQPGYNPYQQQYAPQPPQQQGPYGGPGQYAQGMPAMAGPGNAPVLPSFTAPTVGSGDVTPAPAELAGRAVLCLPTRYDPNATYQGQIKPSVTFDLVVLDGPVPFVYGAAPKADPPRPNPVRRHDALPVLFRNYVNSNGNIVTALKDSIGGAVLGRIVQGITRTAGNSRPWNLAALEPGDPAQAIADALRPQWAAFVANPPVPVELPPAQPQQQYAPAAVQQWSTPAAQAQAAQQWAPAQQYQAANGAPQQQAAQGPPAGWQPEVWNLMTDQQKAVILGGPPAAGAAPQQFPPGA